MYEDKMYYNPKYEQGESEPSCCPVNKEPKLCNCKPLNTIFIIMAGYAPMDMGMMEPE